MMDFNSERNWCDFTFLCAKMYLWISSQTWCECMHLTMGGRTTSESVMRSQVNNNDSYCSQLCMQDSLHHCFDLILWDSVEGGTTRFTSKWWSLWVRIMPSICCFHERKLFSSSFSVTCWAKVLKIFSVLEVRDEDDAHSLLVEVSSWAMEKEWA